MKVWVVCDTNHSELIIIYDSLEKAKNHKNQYDGIKFEDCWILDESGTEIK